MNPTLAELYQRVILQHNRQPQNFGPLPSATHHATLHNPLCGDQVTLHLRLDAVTASAGEPPGLRIAQAHFEGESCALARASASLLTQKIAQASPQQALALAATLRAYLQAPPAAESGVDAAAVESLLGDLVALQGVREVPSRLRCVTLPWEALAQVLAQAQAQAQAHDPGQKQT
jgi:nitrogen fixation NifU-like protein